MRFPWPRRRHDNRNASPDAKAARAEAERSKRQAEQDRARARRQWAESQPVIQTAREHNAANHFDRWLHEQLGNGR